MKEIGLFGYGNFGKLIYDFLKDYFKIFIYDRVRSNNKISFSSLEECASKSILIFAVPVQDLESLLISIKSYIKKRTIAFDVCSTKVKPIELMLKILPRYCEIVGTHPLFGTESIRKDLNDLKIVLSPIRIKNFNKISDFLENKLKIKVIVKEPEEHDKEMAEVQGLTHFLGKALNELNIKDSQLKTLSYQYLLKMKEIIQNDSDALFYSIQNENIYADDYRKMLINKLIEIDERINKFCDK